METETAARERALDAAEQLFYGHGVQAVGMDAVRTASGLSLKRLYALYPSKSDLVEAYLRRRDTRWLDDLAARTATAPDPERRLLAVFDRLAAWDEEPGYRGCAFLNAYGELGDSAPAVAAAVRDHKAAFRRWLGTLTAAADLPDALAGQLLLLAEGAITTAAVTGGGTPARQARDAAATLIAAARRDGVRRDGAAARP